MNTYNIFNRKIMGLDNRVWRTMFFVIIVSTGILGYKFIDRDACTPFRIDTGKNTHGDSFYFTRENIKFFASVSTENISWDFKDNSTATSKGRVVTHSFANKGEYYVTAILSAGCEETRLITVKDRPKPGFMDEPSVRREIFGAISTYVGKEEQYISPALADSFYEWEVLYHPEIRTQNGEKAKYKFDKGGIYIIQLTLDNNRIKSYTRRVIVEDLNIGKPRMPQDVGPLVPTTIPNGNGSGNQPVIIGTDTGLVPDTVALKPTRTKILGDDSFKGYLQKLVENQMAENDFYKYLCNTGNTTVIVNGDKYNTTTFTRLCQEIKGKKEKKGIFGVRGKKYITIGSVTLIRDEANCVDKIEVNY